MTSPPDKQPPEPTHAVVVVGPDGLTMGRSGTERRMTRHAYLLEEHYGTPCLALPLAVAWWVVTATVEEV